MPSLEYSAVIDGDIDRVWTIIKKFGELGNWHPLIAKSEVEGGQPDGLVGVVRRVELLTGEVLRERLVTVDDMTRTLTYAFVETPLPVKNYFGTIRLTAVSDERKVFAQWFSRYDLIDSSQEEQMRAVFMDVYKLGITSLAKLARP